MTQRTFGIGLYAPAGFVTDPAAIDRAVHRLSELGHRVVVDPTCSTRWQRFSAPDDEAPRVDPAHGRRSRTSSSPSPRAAATDGRGSSTGSISSRLPSPGSGGWATATSPRSSSPRSRTPGMTTFAGPMAAYDFGADDSVGVHARSLLGPARRHAV